MKRLLKSGLSVVLFFADIFLLKAQTNFPPFFTIDRTKGCPGMLVNMQYAFDDSVSSNSNYRPFWLWFNPNIRLYQSVSTPGLVEITGNSLRFFQPSPRIGGAVQHYGIDVEANVLTGRLDFVYNNQNYRRQPYEIQVLEPQTPQYQIFLGDDFRVKIVFPSGNTRYYDEFEIALSSGETFVVPLSQTEYIYTKQGTHTIKVTGRFAGNNNTGGNCGTSVVSLTTYNRLPTPFPPSFTWSNGSLIFNLSDSDLKPYVNYQLQIRDLSGNIVQTQNIAGSANPVTSLTVDLSDDLRPYSIVLQPIDCCNSDTQDRLSEAVTYLPIRANTSPATGNIQLAWQAYPDSTLTSFRVNRNNRTIFLSSSNTVNQLLDTNLTCNTEYCYSITTEVRLHSGRNRTLTMNTTCARAVYQDSLPLPTLFFASVNDTGYIRVRWDSPIRTLQSATLTRHCDNLPEKNIPISKDKYYKDDEVNPTEQPYCYTIQTADSCGNISRKGANTCTVWLTTFKNDNGHNVLNWTPFVGFGDSAKYILEVVDNQNQIFKAISLDSGTFSYIDTDEELIKLGEYQYRICVRAGNSLWVSYSNKVDVIERLKVDVPNAFSPNADALNDRFKPIIYNYNSYHLEIFNRWGTMIYQADHADKGWDGTVGNQPAPIGVYTYQLFVIDLNGRKIQKNGMFVLIR